jgi:hypothetical protein
MRRLLIVVLSLCLLPLFPVLAQDLIFAPAIPYYAGDGPYSLFTADFNRDGSKDLAVANGYSNSNNITILQNNGDGVFQSPVPYAVGQHPNFITGANFDEDNYIDLAVTNYFSHTVSILRNLGNGLFQGAVNYDVGAYPCCVIAANFDDDNDIDLAVANSSSDNMSILLNNGDGTFQVSAPITVGNNPASLIASDLDDDGDNDIVVANTYSDNVAIFINNGNAAFQLINNLATGVDPMSVYATDLDGDNDDDLAVVINSTGCVSIFINNGNATFQPSVSYIVGDDPRLLCANDLNGDGFLDLAVTCAYPNSIAILTNNHDGTFNGPITYSTGNHPLQVCSDDFDSDGDNDLVSANNGSDNVSILKNLTGNPFPSDCGELTFVDDFSDGNDDGWIGNPEGTWSIVDGIYDGSLSTPQTICYRLTGNRDWGDCCISFDFNDLAGVVDLIYLRWGTVRADGYLLRVETNYGSFNQSNMKMMKYINNSVVETITYPIITQTNTWYHFDLSLIGNRIICKLNGTEIFTYVDTQSLYPTGLFGFAPTKQAGVGQSHVQFDNVEIRCADHAECLPFANVTGEVRDSLSSAPLAGELIEYFQNSVVRYSSTVNSSGIFQSLGIDAGQYDVRCSKSGYLTQIRNGVTFAEGHNSTMDFNLIPLSSLGTISGVITETDNTTPISGVLVRALQSSTEIAQFTTGPDGQYTLANLPAGIYDVEASKEGYTTQIQLADLSSGQTITMNFRLVSYILITVQKPNGTIFADTLVNIYQVNAEMNEDLKGMRRTDSQGRLRIDHDWFEVGDRIKLEVNIYNEPAHKANHDELGNIIFSRRLDNATFSLNGGATYYDIFNGAEEQAVRLARSIFVYNLLVSVEWNATDDYLNSLEQGFRKMSNHLYDITDGQARLGKIIIFETGQYWDDADLRIFASTTYYAPNSQHGGMYNESSATNAHIQVPRKCFGERERLNRIGCSVEHPLDLSWSYDVEAKSHEFGHHAFALYDEYVNSEDQTVHPDWTFGFMDSHASGVPTPEWLSEMSTSYRYPNDSFHDTWQWQGEGMPCWDRLINPANPVWDETVNGTYCPIISPDERNLPTGYQYLEGPNNNLNNPSDDVGTEAKLSIDIRHAPDEAFDVPLHIVPSPIFKGAKIKVSLFKQGKKITEGSPGDNNLIWVVGANCGDQVRVEQWPWHKTLPVECSRLRAIMDTTQVLMDSICGNFRLIADISPIGPHSDRVKLKYCRDLNIAPTADLYSNNDYIASTIFTGMGSNYSFDVLEGFNSTGSVEVLMPDDSSRIFSFPIDFVQAENLADNLFQIYSKSGHSVLSIDSLNLSIQRAMISESNFSPLMSGVDSTLILLSSIATVSWWPYGQLAGDNELKMHLDADSIIGNPSSVISTYYWNEQLSQWQSIQAEYEPSQKMIIVHSPQSGTYAVFGRLMPSCQYIPGDANGVGGFSGLDVTYSVRYFKGGPLPPYSCDCPPHGTWYVAGDVNGSCSFTGLDVTYMVRYFKGGLAPIPCPDCPPAEK